MNLQVWNILKFTVKKFGNYVYRTGGFAPRTYRFDAVFRQDYMQHAIGWYSETTPDVFVILEAQCDRDTNLGDPMPMNSAAGITMMLDYLKGWDTDDWRVVPPLKCNPAHVDGGDNVAHEVVAVFYRADRFQLTGPLARPAGGWPAPWDDDDITGNPATSGQVRFYTAAGAEIDFPDNYHRRPFMVDLQERAGRGRLFRLLFSHTSPGFHVGGTQAIAEIRELQVNGNGQPDVFVSAGDFNVNARNAHGAAAGFQPLANIGFDRIFSDRNAISTITKPKVGAYPLDPAGAFPRFPDGYLQDKILDNFLLRYNTNYRWTKRPIEAFVYDPVRGFPNNYGTTMDQTLNDIAALPMRSIATFREWQNFWSIRATSDHLSTYMAIR